MLPCRRLSAVLRLAVLLPLITLASPAQAAPIRWQLAGFAFADGGSASGFFDWDPVANTSTNYAVQVSGGDTGAFPARAYTPANSVFLTSSALAVLYFFDAPRVFRIGVSSLDTLDTPAAVLGLAGSAQASATGFIECFNCIPFRTASAGDSTAYLTAVPEPTTVTLLAVGAGLSARRRRRTTA